MNGPLLTPVINELHSATAFLPGTIVHLWLWVPGRRALLVWCTSLDWCVTPEMMLSWLFFLVVWNLRDIPLFSLWAPLKSASKNDCSSLGLPFICTPYLLSCSFWFSWYCDDSQVWLSSTTHTFDSAVLIWVEFSWVEISVQFLLCIDHALVCGGLFTLPLVTRQPWYSISINIRSSVTSLINSVDWCPHTILSFVTYLIDIFD